MSKAEKPDSGQIRHVMIPKVHVSYGLNLGWGGPLGDHIQFSGDLLRDRLQIPHPRCGVVRF